jgi:hypothetical protein
MHINTGAVFMCISAAKPADGMHISVYVTLMCIPFA